MIKGLDSTITSRDEFRARGKSNWVVLTLQSPGFGEHAHEKIDAYLPRKVGYKFFKTNFVSFILYLTGNISGSSKKIC